MELVFATHNANKAKEIAALVPKHITILSLAEIGCTEDIAETSPTIEGNALQKARYVKEKYGYDCFADDTGLEVNALQGEPGVYSARYAGAQKSATDNMSKLLDNLATATNRSAQFKTVIALVQGNKETLLKGICKGEITLEKRGNEGFGYDPIFLPEGYFKTFAEMPLTLKNKIGHRGKAVQKLIQLLESEL